MCKILLVEDDPEISSMLQNFLKTEQFQVIPAYDGESACAQFESAAFSLILLDLMIPKLDGMEVMNRIRAHSTVPIIILSAKDTDSDKTLGLALGADDYITKPFSVTEVLARIKANIRRSTAYAQAASQPTLATTVSAASAKSPAGEILSAGEIPSASDISSASEALSSGKVYAAANTPHPPAILKHGALTMNLDDYSVTKQGRRLNLTAKEFELLKLFLQHPRKVYTKEQIYSRIWQDAYLGDENAVNVHISRLRAKIEDNPREPRCILTVWGIGYKLGETGHE